MGLGEFLSGVGDVIQTGIQTLPAIISAGQGQPVPSTFPALGIAPPGIPGLQVPGITPGVTGPVTPSVSATSCATFQPSRQSVRPVREIRAINPSNMRIESWRHRGTPLVYSGDRAIARQYAKATGHVLRRRSSGGTTRRRTTRRR